MRRLRCFLIGHRDAPDTLYPALRAEVARHISQLGVGEFVVGHYGGFDRLAAKALLAAKQGTPDLRLYLLLPYHPVEQQVALPDGFSGTVYPQGMETVPRRAAIVRANRYMIDHADYLIAYAWQCGGNATKLVEYAQKRQQAGRIEISMLPWQGQL